MSLLLLLLLLMLLLLLQTVCNASTAFMNTSMSMSMWPTSSADASLVELVSWESDCGANDSAHSCALRDEKSNAPDPRVLWFVAADALRCWSARHSTSHHVVVFVGAGIVDERGSGARVLQTHYARHAVRVIAAYQRETDVLFAAFRPLSGQELRDFMGIDSPGTSAASGITEIQMLVYAKLPVSRKCLTLPALPPRAKPVFVGACDATRAIDELNALLKKHRSPNGSLNLRGRLIAELEGNFYRPPTMTTAVHDDDLQQEKGDASRPTHPRIASYCPRVPAPKTDVEFFEKYVSRGRPVVFVGAARQWRAINQWTHAFFRKEFGSSDVHIKLTPDGVFEGCEDVSLWQADAALPEHIRSRLQSPDKVMVRPANLDMSMNEFIDLLQSHLNSSESVAERDNVAPFSAYLEYCSISSWLPRMMRDVNVPDFARFLHLHASNVWISGGSGTVGKLHFDEFDNLLAQIRGTKRVLLLHPFRNEAMYEGHIRQAILSFNGTQFARRILMKSTSMVMSPIDITQPDFGRYPEYRSMEDTIMDCTIHPGDILYLPPFWWHEVVSSPDTQHADGGNIAVNFWFHPFIDKEFPCAQCRPFVNHARYSEWLDRWQRSVSPDVPLRAPK